MRFLCYSSLVISERLVFKPDHQIEAHPSDFGLDFEELRLQTSDGLRLHAWLFPGKRDVAFIWFHGNSGNITQRLDTVQLLHDHLGVSILLFDYRGYGRSEGRPSEPGVYRDGEAAVAWVRQHPRLGKQPLVLFGRSLGSAIAVEMALRFHRPPAGEGKGEGLAGVVLEAAFLSIQEVAKKALPGRIFTPLFTTRFNNAAKIKIVRAPVLIIHGDRDGDVPFSHGLRLFKRASEPKWLYTVAGAGHDDIMQIAGEEYFATLDRFLERIERKSSTSQTTWLEVTR